MAVTLAGYEAGDDEARAFQLAIEYEPEPPYDSGSLEKADMETQQRGDSTHGRLMSDRVA